MLKFCIILLTVSVDGTPKPLVEAVFGRVIRETRTSYIIDFREGLRGMSLNPYEYRHVTVDKQCCTDGD